MDDVIAGQPADEADLSALELLAVALEDALEARRAGLVCGSLDEVALHRAARRAARQDAARFLRLQVAGGAA